jgi:RimJ/RimL family protein N-acetyltransferase
MSRYSFEEIIPGKTSEARLREYHELRKAFAVQYQDVVDPDFQTFRETLEFSITKNGFTIFVFRHEGRMIGYLRYWVTNPHHPLAQNNSVLCYLPEEHMNGSLQKLLLSCLLDKLQSTGQQKCLWRSSHGHILELIRSLGPEPSNSAHWFRLAPSAVKDALIDGWLARVDLQALRISMQLFDFVPNLHLEEVAKLSNELVNDMKREDTSLTFHVDADYITRAQENFRKTRQHPYHLILRNDKGELIGMSLLMINKEGTLADQRLTGVVKDWRKRGLAKWMKAKMLRMVKDDYKTVSEIRTECFSANTPMIAINKALGYELYRTDHDFYITPRLLESFLKGAP